MHRFPVAFVSLVCMAPGSLSAGPQRSDVDAQVLGAWQIEVTTPDGVERRPLVILGRQHDRHVAWAVLDGEPQQFRSVELRDDALVATIEPREVPGVTVALECRLAGENRCAGVARYRAADGGPAGELPLSGRRLEAADFEEHSVWRLRFDIPGDGLHEPLVTVVSRNGAWYGWYEGMDHDLPATLVDVAGDRVVLTVSGAMEDGTDVKATFSGTVSGDLVGGTVAYQAGDESGEVPFDGRLVP